MIISLPVLLLFILGLWWLFSRNGESPSQYLLAKATRHELKVVVSTNGLIEPASTGNIYAPLDGFITQLDKREGDSVGAGELLMRIESKSLSAAKEEAEAALLQARRQAQPVVAGPPKEELTAVESPLKETELELARQQQVLQREEGLLKRNAAAPAEVETLRAQVALLEERLSSLQQKKQDLLTRYSTQEKGWEQGKLAALEKQAALLRQEEASGSLRSPRAAVIFSVPVKRGAFVTKGELVAQIYQPGAVRLRTYVDEPELGRIAKGQPALIDWDGLPDRHWTGHVEQPAQQVVSLGNRSVGYVICSIDGSPAELIPNINVKVQIVTASKAGALVLPRAAVTSRSGQPAVLIFDKGHVTPQTVRVGLVSPQEIEILEGITEGTQVVINPGETTTP